MNKGDTKEAKWHLKKAEKWAQDEGEPEMLALLEQLRVVIDNPLASLLPPGFDPSMLDMGFDPDDYFDDDDDGDWY